VSRRELTRPGEGIIDRQPIECEILATLTYCQHGLSVALTPQRGPDDAGRVLWALWDHTGRYGLCTCRFHLAPGPWEA
jgi:hypothetical protein